MPVLNVSRETSLRLKTFSELVQKWNRTINLVAKSTLPDIERRHIADSLQLRNYAAAKPEHWLDLGSGGGMPGLVIAAELSTSAPNCKVTLIESDQRKAVFLREAARIMHLNAVIIAARIEDAPPQQADVVSARALAPLPLLCRWLHRHMEVNGTALLLKGASVMTEIDQSKALGWRFDLTQHKSLTDDTGKVLELRNLSFETIS